MTDNSTIALPRAPESAPPFRFPLVASLAPVVVSVALWLITGSAFALVFAALGPVTALASFVDSRWATRRSRRRERQRFSDEARATRAAIRARLAAFSGDREERIPDGAAIVQRRGSDPARWSQHAPVVSLGRGRSPAGVPLEQRVRSTRPDPAVESELDALQALAESMDLAPIAAEAALGIGVVGPAPLASAVGRGYAVQLAWALDPAEFWCALPAEPDPERQWLAALPHRRGSLEPIASGFAFGAVGSIHPCATVAIASSAEGLPGTARVVVRVGGDGSVEIARHPDRQARQVVEASFVSREDAAGWARGAAEDAARHGLGDPAAALPASVALGSLAPAVGDGPGLAAIVGVSADGPLELDLVEHGPHAIVGGTTGSGKSELLVSWVLAMAAARAPSRVNFLLVDFKGGAAFDGLRSLPHTVGMITDLDARAAARALASLRAELAHRERALAAAGVRTIDEPGANLPRLVVVVDEFAAMITDHPDLHALFADLAARGRSLGVHLVLCTQRPVGVVRDGVFANADLRVSLRVNNPSDSAAVVGTDAAARIPAENRGRAIVALADATPRLAQFAIATRSDAESIAHRWAGSPAPRRPWLEPLPGRVATAAPDGDGVAFGVLDLPAEQRRATAMWREGDGHVLVLGAPGSGKSTALRALSGESGVELPRETDAAWDAIGDLVARLDAPPRAHTVTIDDLDALLARFGPDHRAVVVDRLARVLREGGQRGIRVAMSAQRLAGELQSLASLVPSRLWLRHTSRQELVIAGGDGATHDDRLPPGGGWWSGDRVQVLWREPNARPQHPARLAQVADTLSLAIVTTRPGWLAEQLGATVSLAAAGADLAGLFAAGGRTILVGDVDEWQARWGALSAVRQQASILFHGCSVTDFRALTRSRDLPPPLAPDPLLCWRLEPDGTVARASLSGV